MTNNSLIKKRPHLSAENLMLRHPNKTDVAAIIGAVGDWEVARCLSRVPHPYTEADALYFLDHIAPYEWTWAITVTGSDVLVGVIGLTPEKEENTAELGYWLSRSHWGQGIATTAARAVVSFGFEKLAYPFIRSGYFLENPASGRVLQKIGFVETGRATRPCLAIDGNVPSVEMRLQPEQLK